MSEYLVMIAHDDYDAMQSKIKELEQQLALLTKENKQSLETVIRIINRHLETIGGE